jgi:hypothetical protein
MLHRDTLPRIRFLVDPILTKVDCYNFEHRHPTESLIDQVSRWGRVVQVGDIEQSPMWDSGLNSMAARRRSNRRRMEQRIFKRTRW